MDKAISDLLEGQCNYFIYGKCDTHYCIKRGKDNKPSCLVLEIYRYIIHLEETVSASNLHSVSTDKQ